MRPEPVAGSEYIIPCDMVLVAIGQRQDPAFLGDLLPNRDRRGVPFLDENLRSELPNVWAVGDFVINPTNFISAIGEGRRVAESIDRAGRSLVREYWFFVCGFAFMEALIAGLVKPIRRSGLPGLKRGKPRRL